MPSTYIQQLNRLDGVPTSLKPVATRCEYGVGLSSGNTAKTSYRTRHVLVSDTDVFGVRLRFSNRLMTAGVESNPADTVVYKASVEYNGATYPATFGGSRTVTVPPGQEALSDPVPVLMTRGSHFWCRTMPEVDTLGKKWPVGWHNLNLASLGEGYWGGLDTVDALTVPTGTNVPTCGPSAILAMLPATRPVVAIVGSSSAAGAGDTQEAPNWDYGWPSRLFANDDSTIKLGISSDSAANWVTQPNRFKREHLINNGATIVFNQVGQNDAYADATTFEQVQTRLTLLWNMYAGYGLPVIQATYTPRVTGTFATLAGQTPAGNTLRQAVNTWIRTKPHPAIVDIFDAASMVEDRTGGHWTGKFRVDGGPWTTDGQHLTPLAHRHIANVFRTWRSRSRTRSFYPPPGPRAAS